MSNFHIESISNFNDRMQWNSVGPLEESYRTVDDYHLLAGGGWTINVEIEAKRLFVTTLIVSQTHKLLLSSFEIEYIHHICKKMINYYFTTFYSYDL